MSDPNRRSTLKFVLVAALIVGLLPLGYFLILDRGEGPAVVAALVVDAGPEEPDAGPPEEHAEDLRITEIDGKVEVRRGKGEFTPAQLGLVLQAEDAIRTVEGSARLSAKDAYDVQVEKGTFLEINELNAKLSRFKLGSGLLQARVQGSANTELQVEADKSDAVATTRDGVFAMSSNGAGTVAVGAREGQVEFKAAGKAVLLRAGQESISKPQAAPSEPSTIPSSLFLKVQWPDEKEIARRQVTLSGKTVPGAVIFVQGQATRVEKDGRFTASVRLREGTNVIKADVVDVGGNRQSDETTIRVDTTAPNTNIDTRNLWKKQ